jgi:sodium-dependent dicarboxylate transporter 2/3/5
MPENSKPKRNPFRILLFLGPTLGLVLGLFLHLNDFSIHASLCAGITLWTACWWVFETLPIPITSLIPISLFPLFGILTKSEVASAYGHWLIVLLLGGFILSAGMEKSGAHKRLALYMVRFFGSKSDRGLVFGFIVASASLSMWISNTATTLMLLPIAMAIVKQSNNHKLSIALLLGVAYAANIGGIGTPIGTPPNLLFVDAYRKETGIEIDFIQWMLWAVPIVLVLIPIIGLYLTKGLKGKSSLELPENNPWSNGEIRVLIVFGITALAWITREMGGHGWKHQFEILKNANDASVALIAAITMFIIPDGKGNKLLDWQTANRIPWGLLLLFSGGLTIGIAFKKTGLSSSLGQLLMHLEAIPILLIILSVSIFVTFLTEVTSNTATTAILMVILGPVATSMAELNGIDNAHLIFMFPAVISASCAFMLPVATAPNAVIYGSGHIPIQVMMRKGFIMNIVGALIITLISYMLVEL